MVPEDTPGVYSPGVELFVLTIFRICFLAVVVTTALLLASLQPSRAEDRSTLLLQVLRAGVQWYDAENSARVLATPPVIDVRGNLIVRRESDWVMKPFSHGGGSTMLLGFALQDIATDQLMKRQPLWQKNAMLSFQILGSVWGIIATNRAMSNPAAPVHQPIHLTVWRRSL